MNALDPQVGNLYYSVRRYFVDEFYFRHVRKIPASSRVLDLGGTKIQKRGQFNINCYDLQVVYVNISPAKQPDVVADAAALPFEDACFDVVICSELLEHVPNPSSVLCEANRVLRDGGIILICVPFMYRIHGDPDDYGRYTDYFWQCALKEVGFDDIAIERQGLFFSVLADFLKQYVGGVGVPRPFGRVTVWLLAKYQRWAMNYEQQPQIKAHSFLRSFTTGFGIVAVKK
ncbi:MULTISPECIES: class I SAM-dependent methyltransferase [Cyanophyceae]|uniref:class I SAM-dependent methyltransferase n=1 Tax=Cyanophyceae TaxID=3028117 RepID=UPI001682B15B|nr:class I SAM-dependent methyltransferase [Trichocoleus sp. FACHB-40]MBD2002383.1 methyltransferase domain-containing protein [Trichocoleus sp. FACHB-40]